MFLFSLNVEGFLKGYDQSTDVVFWGVISSYISGFRRGHNCETVLLRFMDDTESGLDDRCSADGIIQYT